MRITDKYVFFYKDWLSNYQRTLFNYKWNEIIYTFSSTEQGFMFIKADTFDDNITANKILATNNPNDARLLGRKVKKYDDEIWSCIRYNIFYELNLAKYSQDKKLRDKLLDPKFDNKIFVEVSPIDKIWGVGLDENDPLIDDEENWKGSNFLGNIITEVRNKLKDENSINNQSKVA